MTTQLEPWFHGVEESEGANFGDVDEVNAPDAYNLVVTEMSLTFTSDVLGANLSLTLRDTAANGGLGTIPLIAMDEGDVDFWNTTADDGVEFCGPARFAALADDIVEVSSDDSTKLYKYIYKLEGDQQVHLNDLIKQTVIKGHKRTVTDVEDLNGVMGYGDSDGGNTETAFFADGGSGAVQIRWEGFKYDWKARHSVYLKGVAR